MARPKKNNADYFSHDADMRNDNKVKALRRKYGLEGYAIWTMLLEHLTDCDFFEYEFNDLNIELLAGDFDIEPERLKEIVTYLTRLQMLKLESGILSCEKLKERFEQLLNKRLRNSNRSTKQTPKTKNKEVSDVQNPQSKVKESKVKESKVHEREKSALDVIQMNKLFWENFQMQNKSQVRNWDKMLELYNHKVDEEGLDYDFKKLKARLMRWLSNWITNERKKEKNLAPKKEKMNAGEIIKQLTYGDS